MGVETRGLINLFVLNLTVVHGINEIYTGYTLVYFIPRFDNGKIYKYGLVWILIISGLITSTYYFLQNEMRQYTLHLLLLSIILSWHSFNTVFLLAKEKIRAFNLLNFSQPLLLGSCLSFLIFVQGQRDLESYIIAFYVSLLVVLSISTVFVIRLLNISADHIKMPYHFSSILQNGTYNQLASLSHIFSNRFNFYLLGNNVLVGLFGNASSLAESIWLISSSAAPIVLTKISNSKQQSNNAPMTLLIAKICFLLSLGFSILLLLIPNTLFIKALGQDFSDVKWLMLNLSPGILFISFATIISHFYSGVGNQKILLIANLSGLFITLSASYFLIKQFGLSGACYATNLSYFVAAMILTMKFMRDHHYSLLDLFSVKRLG
jgi:O-antigen/teichoic acid export membrane protein